MELILRSNTFFEKLGINAKEDRVKNNSVKKNYVRLQVKDSNRENHFNTSLLSSPLFFCYVYISIHKRMEKGVNNNKYITYSII